MEKKIQEEIQIGDLPRIDRTEESHIGQVWEQLNQALPEELRQQKPEEVWRLVCEWMGVKADAREDIVCDIISGNCQKPVLFICCDLWVIGGIERVMTKLIGHFSDQYQVILLSLDTGDRAYEISEKAVSVKMNRESGIPDAIRVSLLAKLMNTEIFLGNANLSADFLPVYSLLKYLGVRSIMMNHCHYLYPFKWECFLSKAMKIRKQVIQDADVVLFLTGVSAGLCTLNGRAAGVMPNPNTFASQDINLNQTVQRKKNIVAVGRFQDPVKRVDRILRTFAAVHRQNPEAKLILVGKYDPEICCDASGKTVGSLFEELKIPSEAVELVGETIHVEEYYSSARVLLFASESEGFGLVLNEAAVFGLPAVAYYYSGIEDIITDGVNGFTIPQNDVENAAQRILSLLKDDGLFAEISRNAVRMASRFSEEEVLGKWECLFNILKSYDGARGELEAKLIEAGIIRELDLSDMALRNCISEYGECVTGMTERICRCDDMLELLHGQYVSLQAENEELKARLQQNEGGAGGKIAGLFRRRT